MDAVFCIPQLGGINFGYTRMPHVGHGVFSAGPIGGSYALPSEPSADLATHLRSQHLAQNLLYGRAPSAVTFVPPPPDARGRSIVRGASRSRAPPEVEEVAAPAGALICSARFARPFFPRTSPGLGNSFAHPVGATASDFLAAQRSVRVSAENKMRHPRSNTVKKEERRQWRLDRELDEFVSTTSVYTAGEMMRIRHF